MNFYAQRDPKLANKFIGGSRATFPEYGCLVCSIASLLSWYSKKNLDPKEFSDKLEFTKSGLLIWNSINTANLEMGFLRRVYGYRESEVKTILKSRHGTCAIEVRLWGSRHWVVGLGVDRYGRIKIYDPYFNDFKLLNSRYKNAKYGFAEFYKKEKKDCKKLREDVKNKEKDLDKAKDALKKCEK